MVPTFHINLKDAKPVYAQIVEQVKEKIIDRELKAGDSLLTVRELAMHLTVNPNTVSKAYQKLSSEGIIQTRAGKGTSVTTDPDILQSLLKKEEQEVKAALRSVIGQAQFQHFSLEKLMGIVLEIWNELKNQDNNS